MVRQLSAIALLVSGLAAAGPLQASTVCSQAPMSFQDLASKFQAGSDFTTFGSWTATSRSRQCTSATGCSEWKSQSEVSVLSLCYGTSGISSSVRIQAAGDFYAWVYQRGLVMAMRSSDRRSDDGVYARLLTFDGNDRQESAIYASGAWQNEGRTPPDPFGQSGACQVDRSSRWQTFIGKDCARILLTQSTQTSYSAVWTEIEIEFLGRY